MVPNTVPATMATADQVRLSPASAPYTPESTVSRVALT